MRLKLPRVTILSITSDAGNVTDTPLEIVFTVTVRSIGATGTVFTFAGANFNNVNKAVSSTSETTLDTTVAEDISITVEWSAANAGNSIPIDQGFLQL